MVLHCSSFSKSLGPGHRVGWTLAGKAGSRVQQQKWMTTFMTNRYAQAGLAAYLRSGGYDRHLRDLRRRLQNERDLMISALQQHFPRGTRVAVPEGGYFVWVELPGRVDTLSLTQRAMEAGITIAPGPMFSARRGFAHCLRLNYAQPWSSSIEQALASLGRLASTAQGA